MFNTNKAFYLDDSPIVPGKYIIRVNPEKAFCSGTSGSYGVLPARILHMSYPDYLRLCRDVFGAELIGKSGKYIPAYFSLNDKTALLVEILNNAVDLLASLKENPDWEKQKRFVDTYFNQLGKNTNLLTIEDIKEIGGNE